MITCLCASVTVLLVHIFLAEFYKMRGLGVCGLIVLLHRLLSSHHLTG